MKNIAFWFLRFHVCCGAVFLLCTQSALSVDAGGYLRLDGGMVFPEDVDLSVDGNSGRLKLESGFRVDGAIGYDINRWVSAEVQVGYFFNSSESLTLGNQTEHLDDTEFEGIPILANVVLRYANQTDFIPYLRGGAGCVISKMTILGDSDTSVVFAYELGVGVIYNLDERAWIDIGYKFLATADPDYDIGIRKVKASDVRNHFIGASVTWRF